MFGKHILPYDEYGIDNGEYRVRYSADASDTYKAAKGRPLGHLQIFLHVINPDRPGMIPLLADHYYDPPPFASAQEAGRAMALFLEDRESAQNPYGFPAMRHPSGAVYKLPPTLDPTD